MGAPPAKTYKKSSIPPPPQWPAEVSEHYEAVRSLGTGGFASVMLARSKTNKHEYVAMKIVGSEFATPSEVGYAHREIDILQALKHPNIMRVLQYWEPAAKEHKCAAVIALTYSRGPTLAKLLKTGGALSLTFARVVMAQVTDALAYLHNHAVIHRDIKPDNLIVTGASLEDSGIWQEEAVVLEGWNTLRKKWHVTLVDFGFARALTPQDVKKPSAALRRESSFAAFHAASVVQSKRSRLSISRRSSSNLSASKHSRHNLDRSMSRHFTKRMSALGNRDYAAPEITKSVQKDDTNNASSTDGVDVTSNLSKFVSEYGLMVDAYSLGKTLHYMLTGVSPHESVQEVIAAHKSAGAKFARWMGKKINKTKKQRKMRYVLPQYLPTQVQTLIAGLTQVDEAKRMSIRVARNHEWISPVLGEDATKLNDKIVYLDLNKKASKDTK